MTKDGRARLASVAGREAYIASYGGSFAFRAICNLVIKGLQLVVSGFHITLEPDERAARAWLSERRREYLARTNKR